MTSLREAIARAICVADGYDPDEDAVAGQAAAFENFGPRWQANHWAQGTLGGADYVEMADAVLAILPDAEALAEALKYARAELWEALHSDMTEKQFEKQFGEIDAALANYRKGTGREG